MPRAPLLGYGHRLGAVSAAHRMDAHSHRRPRPVVLRALLIRLVGRHRRRVRNAPPAVYVIDIYRSMTYAQVCDRRSRNDLLFEASRRDHERGRVRSRDRDDCRRPASGRSHSEYGRSPQAPDCTRGPWQKWGRKAHLLLPQRHMACAPARSVRQEPEGESVEGAAERARDTRDRTQGSPKG